MLILDRDNKILYANQEALNLLNNTGEILPEMQSLCDELKAHADDYEIASSGKCALFWREGESLCSMRALLIGAHAEGRPATHVMVLIEKVTNQRNLNLKKAKSQYRLTDREIEVVTLVDQGFTNKEIGSRLSISEHTIKDHIKNIMRKMDAASRSEIIHILK